MKRWIIISTGILFVIFLYGSMFPQAEAFFNKKLKNKIADLEYEVEMLKEAKKQKVVEMSQELIKTQNQLNDANKKIEALQTKLKEADKKIEEYKKQQEKNEKQLDEYIALQKKYEEVKAKANEFEKKYNELLTAQESAATTQSTGETLETETEEMIDITK